MLKKLHFLRLCLLSIALVIGGGNAMADPTTYTITFDSSSKSGKNDVHWTNTSTSSLTHDGVTWNTSVKGTSSITSSTTVVQIGSKNNPASEVTISTTAFANKKIISASLTGFCMTNEGPALTITAGTTEMLSNEPLVKTTSTEYKSTTGNVVLGENDQLTFSITSSVSAAICIFKIEVIYEDAIPLTNYTVAVDESINGTLMVRREDGTEIKSNEEVPEGTVLNIENIPNEGYRLQKWEYSTDNGSIWNDGEGATYIVTCDVRFRAIFEEVASYSIAAIASPAEAGSVVLEGNTAYEGTTVSVKAEANAGYKFTEWLITGEGAKLTSTTENPTTFTMGTENVTITATFTPIVFYTVTYSVNGETYKTLNVEEDTTIPFDAPTEIPEGYVFMGWSSVEILDPTNEEPKYVTAANCIGNITYYAVLAKESLKIGTITKMYGFEETDVDADWEITDKIEKVEGNACSGQYAGKINTANTYITFKHKVDVKEFSFALKRASSNKNYNVYIETSTDNIAWEAVETYMMEDFGNGSYTKKNHTFDGNIPLYVRFHCYNTTAIRYVDDVAITYNGEVETYIGYCTTIPNPVEVIVGAVGYATFCNEQALDFTDATVKAYIAIADGTTGVNFKRIKKVPANTGVLLYAEGGVSENIPVLVDDVENTDGNVFIPAITQIDVLPSIDGNYNNYILNNKNGNVGFYPANNKKVGAGKAYIRIGNSVPVKGFITLPNGDGETGIQSIKTMDRKQEGIVYNMIGQRVSKTGRGLYIVNGKKMIMK